MLGDARTGADAHGAHRARQRLGRRGGRPPLARRRQALHLDRASATAGGTSTSSRATARSPARDAGAFDSQPGERVRRAVRCRRGLGGGLDLLHRVARQPDPALSLPRAGSTARASRSASRRRTSRAPQLHRSRRTARWALHTWSAFGDAADRGASIRLPTHESVRTLVDNARLSARRRTGSGAAQRSSSRWTSGDGTQARRLDDEAAAASTRRRSIRCCSTSTASRRARRCSTRGAAASTSGT